MSLDAPDATCRYTGSRRRERAVIFSGRTTGLRSSRAVVVSADDVSKHFKKVPTLVVFGDNTVGSKTGDERRKLCTQTVDALRAAGGKGNPDSPGGRPQGQFAHDDDG
jgi:hypothetical protein